MGNASTDVTFVVSGLPRSGTSMMMRMLAAGGLPLLTDGQRTADEDNPHGYYEFEPVKRIRGDASWLGDATGRCVKIIHGLLMELPMDRPYRVIFMLRDIHEVLASQAAMLHRVGKPGAKIPPDQLADVFDKQVQKVLRWLERQTNVGLLTMPHRDVLADPKGQSIRVNDFVGGMLDVEAMAGAVDAGLYRQCRDATSS